MSTFRSVSSIATHHHACLLYGADAERWDVAAAYVDAGLRAGELVLLVAEQDELDVVGALTAAGANCSRHRDTGQLQVLEPLALEDPRSFDPERLAGLWMRTAAAAAADGFRGVRVVADAAWAQRTGLGVDDVLAYERAVGRLFARHRISALCLYDEREWAGDELVAAIEVHPSVLCGGWHHHLAASADDLALTFDGKGCLRVVGHVDLTTVARFADVVRLAVRAPRDLTLDLAEADFVDVRGLEAVHAAARTLVARGHALTLRGAPPVVRRAVELLGEPVRLA